MTPQSFDSRAERVLGGLWGAVVGDALGVPVEFKSRDSLKANPVTSMRGHGTHDQPAGTWSDDSSMMMCTVESLSEGFDLKNLAAKFLKWRNLGLWTPWGSVFDIGITTNQAINRLEQGVPPIEAGSDHEDSNGNGSLMRILPVALYGASLPVKEHLALAHQVSSITHRHPRSQLACGFYCLPVRELLKGEKVERAVLTTVEIVVDMYEPTPFGPELVHFNRLTSGRIEQLSEPEIESSGYAVHTLEASVWCLLNSNSYRETLLRAVNLGDDTDTTGTVAGGLAGVRYGLREVPEEWLDALARRSDLKNQFNAFLLGLDRF